MNPEQLSSTTRRNFLKEVAMTSMATVGTLSPPRSARAEPPASAKKTQNLDQLAILNLGFKPSLWACGAVIILTKRRNLTFLTFAAEETDGQGQAMDAGQVLIELKGCVSRNLDYDKRTSNLSEVANLRVCQVYEVENSSWVKRLQPPAPKSQSGTAFLPLRHFIFTFCDTNFACLAQDLVVELREKDFATLLAYTEFRDLEAG